MKMPLSRSVSRLDTRFSAIEFPIRKPACKDVHAGHDIAKALHQQIVNIAHRVPNIVPQFVVKGEALTVARNRNLILGHRIVGRDSHAFRLCGSHRARGLRLQARHSGGQRAYCGFAISAQRLQKLRLPDDQL